jgi:hypothetical protein
MKIVRIGAIAVLFSIALYLLFFVSFLSTWRRVEQLANHGRTTSGIVISKEPSNHESIRYEYWVDGLKYVGTSPAGMNGLPSFSSIRVDDTIPVTYSLKKPSESFGGPRPDVYATMSFFLFCLIPGACLLLGILAAIGLHHRRTFLWRDMIPSIKALFSLLKRGKTERVRP